MELMEALRLLEAEDAGIWLPFSLGVLGPAALRESFCISLR